MELSKNASTDGRTALPDGVRYAQVLDACAKIGLAVLIASFLAYVFGLLPAHVPLERMPQIWGKPVDAYVAATGVSPGWAWLRDLRRGESASLLGIIILAGCSLPCLAALIPLYLRQGGKFHVVICALTIAVLLLAASGVLSVAR